MVSQRKRYLSKNTALFALDSIGTRLITFLLVPLYTVAFATEEYGGIDLITTIATIAVPIITINIGEAVMRFSLDEDSNKNNIISIGLFFLMLSFVFGFAIVGVVRLFPKIEIDSSIIYWFCVTQGIYRTFECVLRGKEKLFEYAIGHIISVFTVAVLNILFLTVLHLGIKGYFYAYIISYCLASIYCFWVGGVISSVRHFALDCRLMKTMASYSIVLVPNSLMWWIMNSSDHVMVTSMIGLAANGVYAISYKIPSILSSLSTVFNQAWSYSAIHENKSEDRESFNNTMFDKLIRFQFIITVFLMCVIKPFLKVYTRRPDYYDAWLYTPYLLAGYFFLTLGSFLSTFYTVNKDSKGFLVSGSIGAVLNVALNWLLIPRLGTHGAAFATCVSYIAVFVYRIADTRKYMRIFVFKRDYVIGYCLLVITAVSMFMTGIKGQLLLILETVIMCVLNRGFLKECIVIISRFIKSFFKRKR